MSPKVLVSYPSKVIPRPGVSRRSSYQVAASLWASFRYAWAGVQYAFTTQRNFRIHTLVGAIAITLGSTLQLTLAELAIIVVTTALVMAMELMNTALESVVDLTIDTHYHELAKVAKDCAAGAVFICAMVALVVAALLLVPPVLKLFLALMP
ncbi:diacylglycerol kinase family protein [Thermosynechococcaceae cyanobacterium BACA0444]|uniref:Diacylglycerol kinase family protein n=1 Tax=Pseudocalidococcus azoricus BACA0444 TaxID=2918990 RepID=A0AAE4JWR6_9CYAN|nr:diacylglycerol kinase family protein [Pseudocalidococcus azoricus]MDS3861311.1 diacylglycerol kinase family protein [Pseudocalidococcus azoricus BACA0444]